jgi:hypothetical protein
VGNLAAWGKGRTFPAVDPANLPRVVTLDTKELLASSEATKDRARPTDLQPPPKKDAPPAPDPPPPPPPAARAALEEADPCALLEGLGPWPTAVPPAAAPAPRLATTLALRFAGDRGPALVLGRHGLARTAALAFDPADLAAWDGFAAAAARLVRGLAAMGPGPAAAVEEVAGGRGGTRVAVVLAGPPADTAPVPRVEALHPEGDSPAALPVERTGPRRFAVTLPPGPPGPRALVLRTADGGAVPLGLLDPGPPAAAPDAGFPARLAAAAGLPPGGALPPAGPGGPGPARSRGREAPLLVAAALLLLLEAGLRRRGGELDRAAGAR